MEYKDYYATLGVNKKATQDEIKHAYRRLARKYHPDVSKEKNAEEKFKDLQEAYEVLKDPEKRGAYDQLGSNWKAGQEFRPPPNWGNNASNFHFYSNSGEEGFSESDLGGFSDFFSELFGRAQSQAGELRLSRQKPLRCRRGVQAGASAAAKASGALAPHQYAAAFIFEAGLYWHHRGQRSAVG